MTFFGRTGLMLLTVFFVFMANVSMDRPDACAQSLPVDPDQIPDSCDPDYMDVLNIRAYLEGKREMETAQRVILKQDSVLEYSCFNEAEIWLGTYGGRFSEYGYNAGPGSIPGFDGVPPPFRIYPNSLENALSHVVEFTLVRFLDSFSHIYGGGTFPITPNPLAGCNPMNIVWYTSKCKNFDPNWWVRFEDLSAVDIRIFPIPCAPLYDPDRITNINTAIGASYPAPYDVDRPTPPPNPRNGAMDFLDSHLPTIRGACAGGIETGVTVQLWDRTATPPTQTNIVSDAVCVQPKCYFTGTGCTL